MHTAHLIVSSAVALVFVLFDLLWCFKKECIHIWRAPFKSIKGVYIFARYYPLLHHITNICLFAYFKPPFSTGLCQKWFLFQQLSCVSFQIPFDAVVCLRVFALYGRSMTIGIFCIIVVITDGALSLVAGISLYRQADFGPLCSTRSNKYALVAAFVFQTLQPIMWGLTFRQQQFIKKNLHPTLRAAVPFLPTVVRDASVVLAISIFGFSLSVPYSIVIRLETHLVFPWGMSFLSIFCCHLLLSIRAKMTIDSDVENIELDDPNSIITSLPELPPSTKQPSLAKEPTCTTTPKQEGLCSSSTKTMVAS